MTTDTRCDARLQSGDRCPNRGKTKLLVNVSRADRTTVTHLRLVCGRHDHMPDIHADAPDNRLDTEFATNPGIPT